MGVMKIRVVEMRVMEYLASAPIQATTAQIVRSVMLPGQSKQSTQIRVLKALDALMAVGAVKLKPFGLGYAYRHATTPPDAEVLFVPHGRPRKTPT